MKKVSLYIAFLFISLSSFTQETELFFKIKKAAESGNDHIVKSLSEKAFKINHNDIEFYEELAELYYDNDFYNMIEKMPALKQKESKITFYKACVASLNNNFKKSTHLLNEYLKYDNKYYRGYIRSHKAFKNLSTSSEWQRLWMKDHYSKTEIKYESALNYYRDSNYQWALEEINRILKNDNSYTPAYYLKAKILSKYDNLKSAVNSIEKAIELNKDNLKISYYAADLLNQAGKYSSALDVIEHVLKKNPYNIRSYLLKAKILNNEGEYSKCTSFLEKHKSIIDSPKAFYLLSVAKFNRSEYTDVIINMNKALKEVRSKPDFFILRADAFRNTGSYENSFKDYSMALDIDPDRGDVYIKYGKARYDNGNKEGACYLWRKALHYKASEANTLLNKFCY